MKVSEFCISEKTQLGMKRADCFCRGITRAAATICLSAHLERPPAGRHDQAGIREGAFLYIFSA